MRVKIDCLNRNLLPKTILKLKDGTFVVIVKYIPEDDFYVCYQVQFDLNGNISQDKSIERLLPPTELLGSYAIF